MNAKCFKTFIFCILKCFYPILRLVADVYFFVVTLLLDSYNNLPIWPKKGISWPSFDDPLLCISAKEAAEKIRKGKINSLTLVAAYIDRIQKVNPLINAIGSENFKNALDEAGKIDEYLSGLDPEEKEVIRRDKPLLGVPFTCKDNLLVKGLICVAGDPKNLLNDESEKDSEVVRRLKEAGAILLATSNMADSMETENDVVGRTNNPYDLRRTVGGSSGGEGALIASAASPFGIGNDLGGSIRVPAAFCGVFGLKPTPGLIPLDGLLASINDPYRWVIGPLCRYAEDLSLIFDILTGEYKKDEIQKDEGNEVNFETLKIYYVPEIKTVLAQKPTEETRKALQKTLKYFETRYSSTTQMVDFPLMHRVFELWTVMRYKEGEQLPKLSKIAKDTALLFLGRIGKAEASYFELGLDFLGVFLAPRTEKERNFLESKVKKLRQQIIDLLGTNGVLLLPTFPNQTPWHDQAKFTVYNLAYTTIFNYLGLPALACPMGLSDQNGLPVSVQLVGPSNSDRMLCAIAIELERNFGGWTIPMTS